MKRLGFGQVMLSGRSACHPDLHGDLGGFRVERDQRRLVMSKHGWIALGLGTFFSLLIGCGLMALMFFSSRSGHDEVADPFRRREPPAE